MATFQHSSNNPLIGTWVMQKEAITITYAFTEDRFITSKREDLGEFGEKISEISGVYVIIGSRILLTSDDGQVRDYPFEINGDILTLNGINYIRQKNEVCHEK